MTSVWTPPPSNAPLLKRRWFSKPVIIISLGLVVLGGLTFIWYVIHTRTDAVDEANIPIITHDEAPLKEKPDSPGGYVSPHADKTVYELISPSQSSKKTLMLKEEDEQPLPQVMKTPEPEEDTGTGGNEETSPSPERLSEKEGPYKVQLASLSSQGAAEKEGHILQKKHDDLLKGLKISVIEAEVNGKKVYRVYMGAFSTKDTADQLCNTLKTKGISCLVKKV